jgi:MFS family permease
VHSPTPASWFVLFTTPKRRSRRQLSPRGRRLISRRLRAKREFHVKIWTASAALAAASGPVIGGLLVQLSWRWIFLVNIPVGLMAIAVAVRFVPDVKRQLGARLPDLLGSLLLVVAIAALALGLVRAPYWGWTGTSTLFSFAVSAVALPAFVWRSARHPAPVLDLNLLRSRVLSSASASSLFYFASFGILLLSSVLGIQGTGTTARSRPASRSPPDRAWCPSSRPSRSCWPSESASA